MSKSRNVRKIQSGVGERPIHYDYSAELVKLFRSQRHDFINHLQVISGLIQIHKEERAVQYINEIAKEVQDMGEIVKLESPEIVACLLASLNSATIHDVKVRFKISAAWRNLADTVQVVPICSAFLEKTVQFAATLPRPLRCLEVQLFAADDCLGVTVGIQGWQLGEGTLYQRALKELQGWMAGNAGKSAWQEADGKLCLTVTFAAQVLARKDKIPKMENINEKSCL